jgi:hypothetical protein
MSEPEFLLMQRYFLMQRCFPQVRVQVSLYIPRFVLIEPRAVSDNVRACSTPWPSV